MDCLADTSAFYAATDRDDKDHSAARSFMRQRGLRVLTTSVVVGETFTLLRRRAGYAQAIQWVRTVRAGNFVEVRPHDEPDDQAIWQSIERFSGVPLSYADASLILLGERLAVRRVFTFDEDFRQAGLEVLPG